MNASSPFNRSGWAGRLFVTLVIGGAAAAVTANVVLDERLAGEPVPVGAPLAATASLPERAQGDPSLPAADKALANIADAPGENATTF